MRKLDIELVRKDYTERLLFLISSEPELYKVIREKQKGDEVLEKISRKKEEGKAQEFEIDSEGGMMFKGRWCVSNASEFKERILREAHCSKFSVHLGADKLYKDLK